MFVSASSLGLLAVKYKHIEICKARPKKGVRSLKDLLCNVIVFVVRTICVAQYQLLYDMTIAYLLVPLCFVFILNLPNV